MVYRMIIRSRFGKVAHWRNDEFLLSAHDFETLEFPSL